MKLKTSEIKVERERRIALNKGDCCLCKKPIHDPCLDHDHKSGLIRGAICRKCNSGLGKLERLSRYGINDVVLFVRQAANYLEAHDRSPGTMVHPAYRTPDERKALVKKRRARKSLSR